MDAFALIDAGHLKRTQRNDDAIRADRQAGRAQHAGEVDDVFREAAGGHEETVRAVRIG